MKYFSNIFISFSIDECVIRINIRDEDEGEVSVECCLRLLQKVLQFYNDFTIALSFVTRDDMK